MEIDDLCQNRADFSFPNKKYWIAMNALFSIYFIEIAELNGKRRLTVPRKSMYEEKTRDMNRKTQEDEELIKGLQSLSKY